MGSGNRGIVQMKLDDGTVIDQWTSFSIRDTFTDPLGDATFELRPNRGAIADYSERFQKGRLVGLICGDVTIGSFIIQSVTRVLDRNGCTFTVKCNTPLVTAYQASVDPDIAKHYTSDTSVSDVVLEAMRPFGFDTIVSDSAANRAAISGKALAGTTTPIAVDELKHKDAQAHEGESAYAFCSRIFTRLGVCLRVYFQTGVLLLTAPDYDQSPSFSLLQQIGPHEVGDHMLDGIEIEDSNDDQYSECVVRGVADDEIGQTQSSMPIARVGVAGLETPSVTLSNGQTKALDVPFAKVKRGSLSFGGHAYNSFVHPYKPKHILDKHARDHARCASVAKLAMGMRLVKGFVLSCEVDGFFNSQDHLWTVDTVGNVTIELLDIRQRMWLLERTLVQDRNGGQKTRLKCIPLGALVLGDLP